MLSIDGLLVTVLSSLTLVVCWFIKRTLSSIECRGAKTENVVNKTLLEVRATNGRVGKVEAKIEDHDIRDDDRFTVLTKQVDRLLEKD